MTRFLSYKKRSKEYFCVILVAIISVVLVRSPWIVEGAYLKERFGESFFIGITVARESLSMGILMVIMIGCMLIIATIWGLVGKKIVHIKGMVVLVSILCFVGSSKLMAELALPIDKLMGVNSGEEYAIAVVMKKQMTLYYSIIMVTYAMSSYYGLVTWGLKKGTVVMGIFFVSIWILLALRGIFVAEVLSWSGVGCYSVAIATLIAVVIIGIMWGMGKKFVVKCVEGSVTL